MGISGAHSITQVNCSKDMRKHTHSQRLWAGGSGQLPLSCRIARQDALFKPKQARLSYTSRHLKRHLSLSYVHPNNPVRSRGMHSLRCCPLKAQGWRTYIRRSSRPLYAHQQRVRGSAGATDHTVFACPNLCLLASRMFSPCGRRQTNLVCQMKTLKRSDHLTI